MSMKGVFFAILAFLLVAVGTVSLMAQNSASSSSRKNARTQQTSDAEKTEGEKRFQQNCGRCHQAPQTLSSRVAPAVLMHMRTRATLSAEDERLILKFMNQ